MAPSCEEQVMTEEALEAVLAEVRLDGYWTQSFGAYGGRLLFSVYDNLDRLKAHGRLRLNRIWTPELVRDLIRRGLGLPMPEADMAFFSAKGGPWTGEPRTDEHRKLTPHAAALLVGR